MSSKKGKVFSAIAMVLIAAVLIGTATYAWFTISTNPEVANLQANVTANGNLEIALDAGNDKEPASAKVRDSGKNEVWSNVVDLCQFFKGETGNTIQLKPVLLEGNSTDNTITIKKPVYGLDGAIYDLSELKRVNAADASGWAEAIQAANTASSAVATEDRYGDFGGVWVFTDDAEATSQSPGVYDPKIYAFEVDYWLRTNLAGEVSLSAPAVSRAEDVDDTQAGEIGRGSFITDHHNVSIVFQVITPGATAEENTYEYFIAERFSPDYTASENGDMVKAPYVQVKFEKADDASNADYGFVELANGNFAKIATTEATYKAGFKYQEVETDEKIQGSYVSTEEGGTHVKDIDDKYFKAKAEELEVLHTGCFIKLANGSYTKFDPTYGTMYTNFENANATIGFVELANGNYAKLETEQSSVTATHKYKTYETGGIDERDGTQELREVASGGTHLKAANGEFYELSQETTDVLHEGTFIAQPDGSYKKAENGEDAVNYNVYEEAGNGYGFIELANGKYAKVATAADKYRASYAETNVEGEYVEVAEGGTYLKDVNGQYFKVKNEVSRPEYYGAFIQTGANGDYVKLDDADDYYFEGEYAYIKADAQYSPISGTKDGKVFISCNGTETAVKHPERFNAKYMLSLASCTIGADGAFVKDTDAKTVINLDANKAKEIKMFVYMDGEVLENKDALLAITEFTMNIQFTHSETLTSTDVEMSEYERR